MAQVPYDHIESPKIIRLDGVRAFNPGDPIPVDTAQRLGLLEGDDAPEVISAYGIASSPQFTDAEIKVAAEEAAAAAAGATNPTPTEGATNQVTPPQAPAETPRRRGTSSTPTP